MWSLCHVKNSGQTENWRLKDIHIGSDSPNTQFGKHEHFQCIKSAEQLLTFVVLVFCQLSALKWLRWPRELRRGFGQRQEVTRRQMALGCYRAPACISCCFHLPLACQELGYVRKWNTQLQEKGNSSTPVAL